MRRQEVVLPITVRDRQGRLVAGLRREDFFVYDNGVRQEILEFNRRRAPVQAVLLMDASLSVFEEMDFVRAAGAGFVRGLRPGDSVSVMQFADGVELLQDWTDANETARLEKALRWRYHAGERTALYDALYLAAEEQLARRSQEGRRVIILLTDGMDTARVRRVVWEEAVAAVVRAEACVYVVSLTASLRARVERGGGGGRVARMLSRRLERRSIKQYLSALESSEALLEGLARSSGGRIFLPLAEDELVPAYSEIAEELRGQYVLVYRPQPEPLPDDWRRIEVLVSPGGYEISSRKGYRARAPGDLEGRRR